MNELTFRSILILFGALQGMILALAIVRIKDRNKDANRLLAFFVLLISLVLLSRLVYEEGITIWQSWPHLFLIPDLPMFLYGPVFYFYIKKLLLVRRAIEKWWWLHFIPFSAHLIILSYYCFESRATYLNRLMSGNLWEVPGAGIAALLQMGVYLWVSFSIFKNYKQQIKGSLSHQPQLTFLKTFFLLAGLCWLTWFYSTLADLVVVLPTTFFLSYHLSWVGLSFITLMLSYFAMSQPEVFKMSLKAEKYQGSNLNPDKLTILEKKLLQIMNNNKPFLNSTLTRQELATQLDIHPKDLSRVINERFGVNFFDFINRYRIEEFKRLVHQKTHQHLSILGIAFEAGFNSKTTFNTAFKKFTGMTPTAYLKKNQIQ